MYALKVLFTLSHIKQVDSRLLIQSTMELEEAFAFLKRPLLCTESGLNLLNYLSIYSKWRMYMVFS
ncbi:MAG: hypothetical protein WAT75_00985, partial [Agathobacter rectalis]